MTATAPRSASGWLRQGLIILGGLLALALAALLIFGGKEKPPKDPYRTASVEQGSITKAVSASGTLEALVTVEVGSQISGQIMKVLVDFNDVVTKGQVLAVLDPQTYESRVAQGQADVASATASLHQAQAQLAQAQADFGRKRAMVDQGIYASSVLDQSQASFKVSQAAVEAARARLAQSQAALRSQNVDLRRTTIIAPIDGIIVDRQIEPGQTVAASFQAPVLFRIAQDLSKVEVKISVSEADIGQLSEGLPVRFTVDAFPDDTYSGVVTQVRKQPVTEQNVVAYVVMAQADNPRGRLLPGMTANADIILDRRDNVLKVPSSALRWQPAGNKPKATGLGPPGMGGPPRLQPASGRMGGQRLIDQLDLDARQTKVWSDIQAEMRPKISAAMSGGDRKAGREAMRKTMDEAFTRLSPSLRPEQRQKLTTLRQAMADGGRNAGGFTGGTLYVLRDDKPVLVPIRAGASDGSFTEVRGLIKAGDMVITGGGPKAKPELRTPFGGGSGRPRN